MDLEQPAGLRTALAGMDALMHLAGRVSFDARDGRAMYRLHVEGTRALLEEIRSNGGIGRLVLASTSGTTAVSRTERIGTEEDTAPLDVIGRWPYYLSKVYEERLTLDYCRKHAFPWWCATPLCYWARGTPGCPPPGRWRNSYSGTCRPCPTGG